MEHTSSACHVLYVFTVAQIKVMLENIRDNKTEKGADHTSPVRKAEAVVLKYCQDCNWQLHPKLKVVGYPKQ
jgi:hypothetical protein